MTGPCAQPGVPPASGTGEGRIPTLDLIRGVAVLGILAINIAGFAGPAAEVVAPVTRGGTIAGVDAAIFAAWLVVFEGKMRALFALLFGASMELFVVRAEAAGRDGQALQLRRLLWLAGFGYLHWLIWWGDILFSYAVAGIAALAFRRAPDRVLLAGALALFALWQAQGALGGWPLAYAETRVGAGVADANERTMLDEARTARSREARDDVAETRRGIADQAAAKLGRDPLTPAWNALAEAGEALAYMLIGVVLLRGGFFAGGWSRRRLSVFGAIALALGAAPTVLFARWAWAHGFPFAAMQLGIFHALSVPHLLMALGYAALLARFAPVLLAIPAGRRLAAAGRMAFSNYIGTTLVMTATFYGWGLGLVGRIGTTGQAGFVLLGWALMLGWSAPWLARFRQGPLEWLWRSLTESRWRPIRI